MQKSKKISRNAFLKKISVFFSLISGVILFSTYGKTLNRFFTHARIYRIPLKRIKNRIYENDRFFILKENNKFTVLSKKCPHLGCTLQRINSVDIIVCPCHGSRFHITGKFISGPAAQNMKRLNYKTDSNNIIIIKSS